MSSIKFFCLITVRYFWLFSSLILSLCCLLESIIFCLLSSEWVLPLKNAISYPFFFFVSMALYADSDVIICCFLACLILFLVSSVLFRPILGFTQDELCLSFALTDNNVFCFSDNGVFLLEDIKSGQYYIEVTNLGYRIDTILNIIVNENNIDLGIIQLMPEAELLGEVVIKATRPVIERLPDRTIFNVENSVKSAGQNTLELLRSVPGVTVSGNNQIMINGKKDIQVMINGKVEMMNGDQLANLLKSIQSSNIKKIEVISNPSAKYDACAKGGILNIVLKTSLRTGISGSIFSNYAQNKYWGNQTGTNININYKKFFLGINYSYAHNNLSLDNYIQRKFNKDTSI